MLCAGTTERSYPKAFRGHKTVLTLSSALELQKLKNGTLCPAVVDLEREELLPGKHETEYQLVNRLARKIANYGQLFAAPIEIKFKNENDMKSFYAICAFVRIAHLTL